MKAIAAAPLRSSYVKGVNFANGYLTESLELVAHAPEYGMTYTLPYSTCRSKQVTCQCSTSS